MDGFCLLVILLIVSIQPTIRLTKPHGMCSDAYWVDCYAAELAGGLSVIKRATPRPVSLAPLSPARCP